MRSTHVPSPSRWSGRSSPWSRTAPSPRPRSWRAPAGPAPAPGSPGSRVEAPISMGSTCIAPRASAPAAASRLACSRWAGASAWIPGLASGGADLDVQHLYRAMDFLHGAMPELQEHLYFQVTDLLSADVSVLFYDTTSVSFYLDEADPEGGLRRHGHSKKKRPDLPQIVVALAI